MQVILLDIEGTTTDIAFVHQVLFPYARQHLRAFVQSHAENPEIQAALAQTAETLRQEQGLVQPSHDQCIDTLEHWIDTDRKHTALKQIQGLLWAEGYQSGQYQGHVYDDVVPALTCWQAADKTLAIYSSGSVAAQKLIFGYSTAGDLTPFFAHYFDTHVGGKKEAAAYTAIAHQLGTPPGQILFLSDQPDELTAAQTAGMLVLQVCRNPKDYPPSVFDKIHRFDQLKLQ